MRLLIGLFLIAVFIFAVTGGAVLAADRQAMYKSQTEIAQAETEGVVAQAVSQSQIAGYEASVDLAGIAAQLEITRIQMEITRLANLIESEKIQAALAQTQAQLTQSAIDLEKAKMERQWLWMVLVVPALILATVFVVAVVMVVLVAVLRRPAVVPYYPRITERTQTRDIVTVQSQTGAIMANWIEPKRKVYEYVERRG